MGKKRKQSVTVPLSEPIEAHGETLHELTLKRPKLKHLKGLVIESEGDTMKFDVSVIIPLVARIADIPESSAGEIDVEDLDAVGAAIAGFFPNSPATSGK